MSYFKAKSQCSFCGKPSRDGRKLMTGLTPNVLICGRCLTVCSHTLAKDRQDEPEAETISSETTCRCAFCGKGEDDVWKLIAGTGAHICDICIDDKKAFLVVSRLRPIGRPYQH